MTTEATFAVNGTQVNAADRGVQLGGDLSGTTRKAFVVAGFGLNVPLWQQYLNFITHLGGLDFGPSLMAFPTPAMGLIRLALPWTVGLLTVSGCSGCTYRFNQFNSGGTGTNVITGTPTYVGGAPPISTWAGWKHWHWRWSAPSTECANGGAIDRTRPSTWPGLPSTAAGSSVSVVR